MYVLVYLLSPNSIVFHVLVLRLLRFVALYVAWAEPDPASVRCFPITEPLRYTYMYVSTLSARASKPSSASTPALASIFSRLHTSTHEHEYSRSTLAFKFLMTCTVHVDYTHALTLHTCNEEVYRKFMCDKMADLTAVSK